MRRYEVEASGSIVLGCGCGERLILLGREGDWYAEGRNEFECGCGRSLTLADRLVEGPTLSDLMRRPGMLHGRQ